MTTATAEKPAATVTPVKGRPSRATRSAARNAKPKVTAAKVTTKAAPKAKPAPKPEAKTPTVNSQKQAVAARMIRLVADGLSKSVPAGVDREDALRWAGELCNYFPGVRAGKTEWDSRLGVISAAGRAAPKSK